MLIGTFSPLVKIFQTQFDEVLRGRMMENPDLMFDKTDPAPGWKLRIYRPSGDYPLAFGYPKPEQDTLLRWWITGGKDGCQCVETDYTGCVEVPLGYEDQGKLFADLVSGDTPAVDLMDNMKKSVSKAEEMSEFRVMRAVNATFAFITKQWQANEENKLGRHLPSVTEFLVLHLKSKMVDRKTKAEREQAKKVEEMMKVIESSLK